MILSNLNGVFTKVKNVHISDEEAEVLIEEAVLQAGIEVRNHARLARQTELNLQQLHKGQEQERRRNAQTAAEQLAAVNASAEARQAALRRAENTP